MRREGQGLDARDLELLVYVQLALGQNPCCGFDEEGCGHV
jgi:hypothetical protein